MRKYIRELNVKLLDTEKANRADQLAKVELETQSTEGEIDEVRSIAKDDLKRLKEQLSGQRELCRRLARAVKNGEEFRDIEVEERLSETGTEIITYRLDVLEAEGPVEASVVDRRAATDQDRQLGLDGLDETLDKVEEETEAAEPGADDDPEEGVDDDISPDDDEEDEATV